MKWILDHIELVLLILLGIVGFIVRLTPSIKDDIIYDKIKRVLMSILNRKK